MGHKDSGSGSSPHVASLDETVSRLADTISHAPASDHAPSADAELKFFGKSDKAKEKQRGRKVKNDRLQQDMDLREKHAEKAVGLAQVAVGCWIFLFAFAGCMNLAQGKQFLTDKALVTLTAGATVNVIAVFLVVVKGLFPPPMARPAKAKRGVKRRKVKEASESQMTPPSSGTRKATLRAANGRQTGQ
jgi:hypothetical protein